MTDVVVSGGSLSCTHQGKVTLTTSCRLTVSGKAVVLFSVVSAPAAYARCTFQTGGSPKPCAKTTVASGGSATRLTVDCAPVLLTDLVAQTDNAGSVTVNAGQSRLTAE